MRVTHVHVDEAAQGRRIIEKLIASWKKLLPFHCGQVVNPDEDEGDHPVLFSSLSCALGSSTMDSCMPIVVIYVLSSPTRGSKSQGSATDANVNTYRCHKDMWSVV